MSIRLILSALFFFFFSHGLSHAGEPTLVLKRSSGSIYEAEIHYDTDVFCFIPVNPPSSVNIADFKIVIESPPYIDPINCIEPVPPITYFVETAHIGYLAPGTYDISWVQPEAFSLSTSLVVGDPRIPSSSPWSLTLLTLSILAIAYPLLRFRS